MFDCILKILDLIIKSTVVAGIIILSYMYWRVQRLDNKIENLHKEFEKNIASVLGQGRGIPEVILDGQIAEFTKERDKKLAPLEREKQRLLSKIPFLK